jgi:proliferating cell nuclear antigen
MFKLKIDDSKLLKDTFAAIAALVDEASFSIEPSGLKLRAMDPSRVAMVDFEWPKELFEKYECDSVTKLTVNLGELLKFLRRSRKSEPVTLSLSEKTGQLQILITGKYVRSFVMPVLDLVEEETPTPKIVFNIKAKLSSESLREAITDANLVSDHVRIEATSEKLSFNSKGDLMGARIELQKGGDDLLDLEVIESSKCMFSLSYLSDIIKIASLTSEIVTLEFSTDMPLKLDFQQLKGGKLIFYLAPRIET